MVSIIKIVLYTKPTAEHQHFLRSSCHPLHTFPFSLALRIQSVCSSNQTFKLRCNELTQAQYLNRRGYSLGLLKQEIQRVHTFTKTHTRNSPHTYSSSCRIPPTNPPQYHLFFTKRQHIYNISSTQLCATMFIYVPLVTLLRTNKPEIR